jgi:hypothetical protein
VRSLERGIPAVLEHSQLPDSLRSDNIEAFRQGVARVIISAKSLVEGFNVPSADLGIIAASSSSVRQRIQSLGRMLRRKPTQTSARIYVLYVRDTEDEAIYEKADWESVIGAEQNRYFTWRTLSDTESGIDWHSRLEETGEAPRIYRPPANEINVSALCTGDRFPGQVHGVDLRIDGAGNPRTENGMLVSDANRHVGDIMALNSQRRARITPAGHLIVRSDLTGGQSGDWRFLGMINVPDEEQEPRRTVLRIQSVSGRRVIARWDEATRSARLAKGPGESESPDAGDAHAELLNWIRKVESEKNRKVREVYWDDNMNYWLEIEGERISYGYPISPLEFPE